MWSHTGKKVSSGRKFGKTIILPCARAGVIALIRHKNRSKYHYKLGTVKNIKDMHVYVANQLAHAMTEHIVKISGELLKILKYS